MVVVACDENGNVSLDDLRAKLAEYQNTLAALMITYPSTHGVYEESFREICDLVHQHGGQVYLDGANFNALVGLSRPGKMGADVAHLNCTKPSVFRMAAAGRGLGPSAWVRILPHSCLIIRLSMASTRPKASMAR